jgi:uncharacterized protein (DUF427 family)
VRARRPFGAIPRPEPDPPPGEGPAPNGLPYESVWSYPRPPQVRPEPRTVTVAVAGSEIVSSDRPLRVCETAGAPVVYVPMADVTDGALFPAPGKTICEFKGTASYFDVTDHEGGERVERAAWTYRRPTERYPELAGLVSFYPGLLECRLDGELVRPQPGGFYGGWVTAEITGPIKGEPGTEGW